MRGSTFSWIVALALTGCAGEGGTGNTDPGGDDFDDCNVQIVEVWEPNHGHSVFTAELEQMLDEQEFDAYQPLVIRGGRAGHTHTVDPRNNPRIQSFLVGETATVTVQTDINSLHSHELTVRLSFSPGCGGVFDDGFDGDGPAPVPPGDGDGG